MYKTNKICKKYSWCEIPLTNDLGCVPFVKIAIRSFPRSKLITGSVTRVTQKMPYVEQALITVPEHQSSSTLISEGRVAGSLVFCAVFCISLFVLFLLVIVLSVLLQFTASNYPFGIFKLFLGFKKYNITVSMISKIMEEILRNYKQHIIKEN